MLARGKMLSSKEIQKSTPIYNFWAVCLDDGCVGRERGIQAMRQCQMGSELQKLTCSPLKNVDCATTNYIPFGKRYFQVQAVKFRASFGSQICSLFPPESSKMGRSCPVLLPCCISKNIVGRPWSSQSYTSTSSQVFQNETLRTGLGS